jgi:hypothetical protein
MIKTLRGFMVFRMFFLAWLQVEGHSPTFPLEDVKLISLEEGVRKRPGQE